jgi:hypothetical protein
VGSWALGRGPCGWRGHLLGPSPLSALRKRNGGCRCGSNPPSLPPTLSFIPRRVSRPIGGLSHRQGAGAGAVSHQRFASAFRPGEWARVGATGHAYNVRVPDMRCMSWSWPIPRRSSRRGGGHASCTRMTRWFSRSHGCCFRRTRWIPGLVPAAALCNFAPSSVDTCWGETSGWLRGQGEVSMCVMWTHSMVRTRAASADSAGWVEGRAQHGAAGVSGVCGECLYLYVCSRCTRS